jgi:hypothetical protein
MSNVLKLIVDGSNKRRAKMPRERAGDREQCEIETATEKGACWKCRRDCVLEALLYPETLPKLVPRESKERGQH